MIDLARLAAVPAPALPRSDAVARGIDASAAYLASDAARRSLELDPYWPKWDSPWWHMLLLHELGEARRIPAAMAPAMAARMDGLLHFFPVAPGEAPAGTDPLRDVLCHCALGSMVQVLTACGLDVDRALPWIAPWLPRYQMADGGLNCDDEAYLVVGECPSSMVATVAPLEAALLAAPGSPGARRFADRAAHFLIERGLVRGSSSAHNAEERDAAQAWGQLAFPRFYFYDVLRGLAALVRWAEVTGQPVPVAAIAPVVAALVERWPDGVVGVERDALAGHTTIVPTADRSPRPRVPASSFALLEAVGAVGAPSEALTRQWSSTRAALLRLAAAGRLTGQA